ncbi:MAG: hypothetical protein JSS87_12800 [Acidobacteria bacterium]|nr:hypothetical protein [Acidobacteriota bacterium]
MFLRKETKMLLTVESIDPKTDKPVAPLCNLDGEVLAPGQLPVETYIDGDSGKRYARVCTILPSNPDEASQYARKKILDRNPIAFDGAGDPSLRGFYVESPDYTLHGIDGQGKPAANAAQ